MLPGDQVGGVESEITVKSMVSVVEASDGSIHLRTKGELNIVQLRGMLQMGDYLACKEYETAMAKAMEQRIIAASPDLLEKLNGR